MNMLAAILTAIAGMVFLSFLLSWPAYMLWNYCLVGAINGVNEVTWLQAWGLSLLCNFLFKSSVSSKIKE